MTSQPPPNDSLYRRAAAVTETQSHITTDLDAIHHVLQRLHQRFAQFHHANSAHLNAPQLQFLLAFLTKSVTDLALAVKTTESCKHHCATLDRLKLSKLMLSAHESLNLSAASIASSAQSLQTTAQVFSTSGPFVSPNNSAQTGHFPFTAQYTGHGPFPAQPATFGGFAPHPSSTPTHTTGFGGLGTQQPTTGTPTAPTGGGTQPASLFNTAVRASKLPKPLTTTRDMHNVKRHKKNGKMVHNSNFVNVDLDSVLREFNVFFPNKRGTTIANHLNNTKSNVGLNCSMLVQKDKPIQNFKVAYKLLHLFTYARPLDPSNYSARFGAAPTANSDPLDTLNTWLCGQMGLKTLSCTTQTNPLPEERVIGPAQADTNLLPTLVLYKTDPLPDHDLLSIRYMGVYLPNCQTYFPVWKKVSTAILFPDGTSQHTNTDPLERLATNISKNVAQTHTFQAAWTFDPNKTYDDVDNFNPEFPPTPYLLWTGPAPFEPTWSSLIFSFSGCTDLPGWRCHD